MCKILSDLATLVSLVSFYLSGPDVRFQRNIHRFKQARLLSMSFSHRAHGFTLLRTISLLH